MNPSFKYSDYIEKESLIEEFIKNEISKIEGISVSSNIGDLLNNINLPFIVIFNDEFQFRDDSSCFIIFSISLKNKGKNTDVNTNLIKQICNIFEDFTLNNRCLRAKITTINNFIDTVSAADMDIKTIISRIEVEVEI